MDHLESYIERIAIEIRAEYPDEIIRQSTLIIKVERPLY